MRCPSGRWWRWWWWWWWGWWRWRWRERGRRGSDRHCVVKAATSLPPLLSYIISHRPIRSPGERSTWNTEPLPQPHNFGHNLQSADRPIAWHQSSRPFGRSNPNRWAPGSPVADKQLKFHLMHNFIIGSAQSRSRPLILLPDFRIRCTTVLRCFFIFILRKTKASARCGKHNRCAEAPASRIQHPISSRKQHFSSISRRSEHL